MERGDSRSSSDSSTTRGGSRHATPPTEPHHLHRIHYVSRQKQPPAPSGEVSPEPAKENYSYVQLTAVHEYIYPVVEEQKRRDSLKKRSLEGTAPPPPPPAGGKKRGADRNRCRHCQELYTEERNVRGSCEYAPDCALSGINAVACVACAECMLYHCMADAEGEFAQHPCECGRLDEGCTRRWLGLALLSLLVPCLWCYPPLRACHWCCVSCGVCGGRHRPAS